MLESLLRLIAENIGVSNDTYYISFFHTIARINKYFMGVSAIHINTVLTQKYIVESLSNIIYREDRSNGISRALECLKEDEEIERLIRLTCKNGKKSIRKISPRHAHILYIQYFINTVGSGTGRLTYSN